MSTEEKIATIASVLCSAGEDKSRIEEKSEAQLDYILSSINENIYLEACAGSGKTEVLGIKAAYELKKWKSTHTGIAVLSFTNEATNTIASRINSYYDEPIPSNHFIGTFSSFIHGHIAQRFGYKYCGVPKDKVDTSFQIIDVDMNQYNNQWLKNYAVDFPFRAPLYANQLVYRFSTKQWFLGQEEKAVSLKEKYESAECQAFLEEKRKIKNNPNLFQYDYLVKQVNRCKNKLWQEGFASFDDMIIIAMRCLKNNCICSYIAKKFPLILIDECQDLSAIELELLHHLLSAGTKIHYIGDIHQSIYSFKDALPNYFTNHIDIHNFKKMQLDDNYRSTQEIVDISKYLGGINRPLNGLAHDKTDGNGCFYIEYEEETEAVSKFQKKIERQEIDFDKSIVLVRTNNLRQKLANGIFIDYKKHPIIYAIQLWITNTPTNMQQALSLLAYQLQKWIGSHGKVNNYYYSEEVCSSSIEWRLILREILKSFANDEKICAIDSLSYSEWYTNNKQKIIEIINEHLCSLNLKVNPSIKSPQGTANQQVQKLYSTNNKSIKIETVHSAKGRTYDAVLLLSTKNATGKTGYWENWINMKDEAARIAYVASTRPRFLLCWGVCSLSAEKREKIERIGFRRLELLDE